MTETAQISDQAVHFSIVIANWNGEPFIERCISSALLSARQVGRPFEVVVVDDASTDASVAIIERRFPQVRLLARQPNRGFAATANEGVEKARGRYVVLLNNDVAVRSDFCPTILRHFDRADDRLFAVTAKTVEWDGRRPNYVKMDAVWQRGYLAPVWDDPAEAQPTHFLQAGACAFERRRFLELGGFDEIFSPGYWEDFDLSWRALAHGWYNIYEPASPVFHFGKASFRSRFGDELVRQINARNHLLFMWLNLADPRLLASHCLWLPVRIAGEIATGDVSTARAFVKALGRIGRVARRRRRRRHLRRTTDANILAFVDTSRSRLSEQ